MWHLRGRLTRTMICHSNEIRAMKLKININKGGDGMVIGLTENDGTMIMNHKMSRSEVVSLFASWVREYTRTVGKNNFCFSTIDGSEKIMVIRGERKAEPINSNGHYMN